MDGDGLGPSGRPCEVVGERVAKAKTWPDSPRALAGRLRRAATFLRKIGIEIGFGREGRARTRTINITTIQPSAAPERPGTQPSAPSASSAPTSKSIPANSFAAQSVRTVGRDADDSAEGDTSTVRAKTLENNARTPADGADANRRPQSAPKKTGAPAGVPMAALPGYPSGKFRISPTGMWTRLPTDLREGGGVELDRGKLDAGLREALRERCLPEHVETEFTRVMDAVFRV